MEKIDSVLVEPRPIELVSVLPYSIDGVPVRLSLKV